MKSALKWTLVVFTGVFFLGLGRMLAAKILPMIPVVKSAAQKTQEYLFDAIALMTGVAGLVLGTKLAPKIPFLKLPAKGGVSATK